MKYIVARSEGPKYNGETVGCLTIGKSYEILRISNIQERYIKKRGLNPLFSASYFFIIFLLLILYTYQSI